MRTLRLPVGRRWRCLAPLLASALCLPLAGCQAFNRQRPIVLYVAISTPAEERISRELAHTFLSRIRELVGGFRRFHPNLEVQYSLYPEDQLLSQIQQRNSSGLGPDLIVTSAELAHILLRQGLTLPMPLQREDIEAIDPALLHRVTARKGRVVAQPLVQYIQLACFDRRRVPQPPSTVQQLLAQSAGGVHVGLGLPLESLFWSAGSLGALPALKNAAAGRPIEARERQGLLNWFRWLQDANIQKDVTFVADDLTLRDGLRGGKFDWINCRSSDLPYLEAGLGDNLGVATLPNGEGLQAAPFNPLRVLALGRDSSPEQRRLALDLAHYSLRPLVQRSFTLDNPVFLPANRHVSVPTSSSRTLATMVEAQRQGQEVAPLIAQLHATDPRVGELEQVIVPLVFGMSDPRTAMEASLRILERR